MDDPTVIFWFKSAPFSTPKITWLPRVGDVIVGPDDYGSFIVTSVVFDYNDGFAITPYINVYTKPELDSAHCTLHTKYDEECVWCRTAKADLDRATGS